MKTSDCALRAARLVALTTLCLTATAAVALQVREPSSRFDAFVVEDTVGSLDTTTTDVNSLAAGDALRLDWGRFRAAYGANWSVYLDRRSGAPLLAEGRSIPWTVGANTNIDTLATSVREFMGKNRSLLQADDKELVLNREGSGLLLPEVWQLVFDRVVAGVPVVGERYVFTIGHGNLISFGTPRWTRIDASPFPDVDAAAAQDLAAAHMQLADTERHNAFTKSTLEFIPLSVAGGDGPYIGALGAGYTSALVWRVQAQVPGDLGTWETIVDAHTGAIRSFEDVNDYAHAKGGVYPLSDDLICQDGCEQPNYPLPYVKIFIGNDTQYTSAMGGFACTPGGSVATTILGGLYHRVADACGQFVQSATCDSDINAGTSGGITCTVPAGGSNGDTHASRGTYYHLNRITEHARTWLPAVTWLSALLETNVNGTNENGTNCNAFFETMGHTLNFLRDTSQCRNTGEIAGINYHEWGHGLDYHDGGGRDTPSEAYGDITSLVTTHVSCMGRGFDLSGTGLCDGYGDACLTCTGVRDLDWDARADHIPSTPAVFLPAHCGFGTGPCKKEEHCEGYVSAEAMWDLATRDLTAAGFDLATAWQITDKLWFRSRLGSGGPAYNCSLPSSNGCSATSWYSKLRTVDDDDGNLDNGTPHAAAIFAAFNRHAIACGSAADASNQSTTTCAPVGPTTLSATISNGAASLTWTPASAATAYRILRNETGCSASQTIVATVTGTARAETDLVNGLTEYYRIQPIGINECEAAVSNCVAATPQPFAGTITLSAPAFSCNGQIGVTVNDANIGGSTTTVSLASTTEPAGETITLTRVAPGSNDYTGTISLTSGAPAPNGLLSVADGDAIGATYIDASDGGGGINLPRLANAFADCVIPVISKVQTTNVSGTAASVTWTTNELANSVAHYGQTPPPGVTSSDAAPVLGHSVGLTGLAECTPYVFAVDSTDVVGNLATDDASGTYYAFTTGKSTQVSYASTDTPIPIPDLSPAGATSTVTVTDNATVQDVNVTINVQHTFDGDLTFQLITPNGTTIVLANPHGGRGDDYTNTVFDDEAAAPLGETAPFTGTFRPDSPLKVADGLNAAGVWKFKALDRAGQDTGTILNWTLQLTSGTPTCGPHASARSQTRAAATCISGRQHLLGCGRRRAIQDQRRQRRDRGVDRCFRHRDVIDSGRRDHRRHGELPRRPRGRHRGFPGSSLHRPPSDQPGLWRIGGLPGFRQQQPRVVAGSVRSVRGSGDQRHRPRVERAVHLRDPRRVERD